MAGVDSIFRATLKGAIAATDDVQLVFHYRGTTGSETDYDTIAVAVGAALNSAFSGLETFVSNRISMTLLDLFEYDFVGHEFDGKASAVVSSLVGTNGGASDVDGVAMLIRFVTQELRRQARKFIPGLIETNVTGNAVAAPQITAGLASAAILNDDITAGGLTLRPCTFNTAPLSVRYETWSDYTQTAYVNALVAYQRRRQPGSGA